MSFIICNICIYLFCLLRYSQDRSSGLYPPKVFVVVVIVAMSVVVIIVFDFVVDVIVVVVFFNCKYVNNK